jgi:murein DD-endopeptidase MepM/ murein hydrolase activator NlpD
MGSPGGPKIAACLLLAAFATGCARNGPPAPVTWRVAPGEHSPERPAQRAPQRTVTRAPERTIERPPERLPEPSMASRAASSMPTSVPLGGSVVVSPGETLYAVARRTNVPLRSLIETNNLQPPFRLVAGQRLTLPQVQQYVAQQGDTVYSVSRRFGVDSSTLASTNKLTAPYTVQSGAPLILPPPVQTAPTQSAPVQTAQPPAARQPPPLEAARTSPPAVAAESHITPPEVAPAPKSGPTQNAPAVVASLPPSTSAPPPPPAAPPVAETPPAIAEPPPVVGRGFQLPVRGTLISGYGPGANGTQNDGINIAAPLGTPIAAVADGEVKYAGNELRGFGNLVLIKHPDGWISAYAHCESLLVKRGERVRRGQTIARVGDTGAVSAPQLHFELRRGTRAVDPTNYLPAVSTAAAP